MYIHINICLFIYTHLYNAHCKYIQCKDKRNGASFTVAYGLSVTVILFCFLAISSVIPALHRHSFTIVFGGEIALGNDPSHSIPKLKASSSFTQLKPQ